MLVLPSIRSISTFEGFKKVKKRSLIRGKQCLLADDSDAFRMLLGLILTSWGYAVIQVRNGSEALDKLETDFFDIILLDLQMPNVSGVEVARRLRQSNGRNKETPIVAFSACCLDFDRAMAMNVGINALLEKPLDHDHLFETINILS